jgi:hypothetical protein
MPTQRITFKEWLPDQPSILDSVSEANNVIPLSVGYGPFNSAVNYSSSASENLSNVFSAKVNSDVSVFAGGATKLFKLNTSSLGLDNVSKSVERTITNVSLLANVATITTSSAHGYSPGDSVTVDASNNTFDGSYTITSVPTSTTFTYAKTYSTAKNITNVELTSNVATITSAAHGYSVSDYVTVDCSNNTFDGNYAITAVTTDTFSYDLTNPNITSVAATGTVYLGIASVSATGTIVAGAYTGTDRWQFMQFGNLAIATNGASKLQSYNVGSSAYFGDLSTSAPIAEYITAVRDFVVCANISGGTYPSRVQWSGINDATVWTATATSQSDFQDIPDGGNITGITGGEFGLVLLEKAVVRMSYIGSPLFFQFDTISRNIGCIEGGSVTQYGGITYFLSDDGFYSCNGQTLIGIGSEKVDRYFFQNANIGDIDSISTSVDPERNLIMWNYTNISGSRSLLIYNFETQKWSEADTDVDYLSTLATSGTSLDAIDASYNINAGSFVAGKSYTIRSLGTKTGTYSRTGTTVTVTITAHGFSTGNVLAIDFTSGTALDGNYTITVTNANTFTLTTAASGSTSGNVEASTSFTNIGAIANTIGVLFTATGVGSGTGVAIDMAASTAGLKTIDTLVTTLDDRLYKGGKFLFGGVRDANIVTFTGTYATGNIITNDLEYGYNSVLTLIRPSVDNGSASVSVASRRMLNDTITYGSSVTASEEDRCAVRSSGRYHRISLTPTGPNWASAIGIDVDYSEQGTR